VVTQEMVEKLKPGMTPSQVRFILGTPLVVDAFHKDRWDYVYRFSKAGTLQESRRIVIVFKDDKLDRIEGDVVPAKAGSATESAGRQAGRRKARSGKEQTLGRDQAGDGQCGRGRRGGTGRARRRSRDRGGEREAGNAERRKTEGGRARLLRQDAGQARVLTRP